MMDDAIRAIGKLGQPRHLVLGLDPGIASCGFALIDINNHEILEMGTRLFDAPTVPKTKQSKAVVRRGFRSARRNLNRTQDRLKHCLRLLQREGLVPQDATAEYFHSIKGDKQPLQLRVDGLDRVLTDREWSLVLYSICKRRGYIPHGEGNVDSGSEDGKVLKAIAQNSKTLEEGSFRTVGEWLSSLDRSRNRGGAYEKCVTHVQLSDELHLLFSQQRAYGAIHAGEQLENDYFEIFDWEKPRADFDADTYNKVGNCLYFPHEKRAARCTLTSELVTAYGALGNVSILQADHSIRRLAAHERDAFIDTLFSPLPTKGNKDNKVTFGHIRKALDLDARDAFRGVKDEEEKSREVYKPQGWRTLRGALGTEGEGLLCRLRSERDLADAVFEAIAYSSSADVLATQLHHLNLSDEEIRCLMKAPYSSRSLNGYGSRSKKALDLLFDCFMEPEVLSLTDAEEASGLLGLRLNGTTGITPAEKLAPYATWLNATGRTNDNPVVLRAMAQMRKVVNAVTGEWGVPNEIHVELARELALSKKAKDAINRANRRNEKDNERIRKQIAELTGGTPDSIKGSLVSKWRLWEEQDGCDIYTGDKIDSVRLVSDDTYTQIDHILPFSRTGDNSWHNKALVLSRNNQNKREASPYEWMTSGAPSAPNWDEFEARVLENRRITRKKREFLLERDLTSKEGDFQKRNLNDTRYMAREVCAYLSDCLAFPHDGQKNHVIPTKGTATAWLRRAWGLNFGTHGEKDRSDDRHHATDACVIAACSRGLVIKTARYSEQRAFLDPTERDRELADALPWPSFGDDVRARYETVIPTRFVPRSAGGQIFEQTVYAYHGSNKQGKDMLSTKGGAPKPAGNALVSADEKSAMKVGDMLCLRLWHDRQARKGKGQWYADPVYLADLPALKNHTYVPRIAKAHTGRKAWKPIPEDVLKTKPLVLYLGDVIQIGDSFGRFAGFNINSANWSQIDILTEAPKKIPSIGKLNNQVVPIRIVEDILGRCWERRLADTD